MAEGADIAAGSASRGGDGAHGGASRRSRLDARAVEALFVDCERDLGRFLVQMVGDRALAEDLLQDTFIDALRHQARWGASGSPRAWLFGIARHRALAALRRRRRLSGVLKRLAASTPSQVDDDSEVVALRDLLARHLDAEDRALVLLRYLHGFDASELAAITGRSPEAVRQRLSRAKKRLLAAATDTTDRQTEADR
jgi:RNA polymerase sigma-70 factor, ECF subfamily